MVPKLKSTQLRIPKELHARLVREAKLAGRSMNAEITERLACSLEREDMRSFIESAVRNSIRDAGQP
jgi:plasmid stability protein